MIRELAERLVESRHRWLIVTGVTLLISLVSVGPQVDQLLAGRSERTLLQSQLAQASEADQRLPEYKSRLEGERETLERLRAKVVGESGVKGLRSWLVSVARQSGCRVRRLDVANPARRPWTGDDDPLAPPEDSKKKTPYQLETRAVTLSVTGAESELLALLQVLDKDGRLKHTQSLELSQAALRGSEMQLDVTLWYFAIAESGAVG